MPNHSQRCKTQSHNRDSALLVVRIGPRLGHPGLFVYPMGWPSPKWNKPWHANARKAHRIGTGPSPDRAQQKNQAVLDSGGGGAVLFGIFAFIAVAIALAMRQSNEQRQADIQRMEVRQQQNKAQEA